MVRVLLEPPAFPRVPARAPRWIAPLRWMLLISGIAATGYAGYAYLESQVYQAYEDWSFDREVNASKASTSAVSPDPAATPVVRTANSPEDRPAPPAADPASDDSLIGRIAIPRLRIRAMVKEGVDDATLRRAVGHVPETVRPGTPGNVGLAGHRDSFFRRLKEVRKNDKIVIETLTGTYQYVVDSTKIVGPQDVEVLAPSKDSILTLVTCYPFHYVGNAPRRYIVRARQLAAEAGDTPPVARSGF